MQDKIQLNSDKNNIPMWRNITDKISYITPTMQPLSANVSVIEGKNYLWVYDVGSNNVIPDMLSKISQEKGKDIKVVLSHFHPDHITNLQYIKWFKLYQGKNTYKYTHIGEVVEEEMCIDKSEANLSIFPMPSSHAKGSLALMADETYCLIGDALYPAHKGNKTVYNAGMVKQQIDLLNKIPASNILLSHREPFVQKKQAVIAWLSEIYFKREKNQSWIDAGIINN